MRKDSEIFGNDNHDYPHDPISCQSGADVVHRKRNHPGIVLKSTALGGSFWDVAQMHHYHKKL